MGQGDRDDLGFDRAGATRKGEELDAEKLLAYVRSSVNDAVVDLTLKQFPGGYSNLTYLVTATFDGRDNLEWVLRRPPFGSTVKGAHDMGREVRVLSQLSQKFTWAPKPVAHCEDDSVLGGEFYLMDRIAGVIVRQALPKGVTIDETKAATMCQTWLSTLVELHGADYQALGLGDFGRPDGYVDRQVKGWTKRYVAAQTSEVRGMQEVSAWLAANIPESPSATVVHNDYKFDNVVFADAKFDRIAGVLDWEMATLGDPLMDLGTALCYWVETSDHPGLQKLSFGPTMLPGMWTRRQLAEAYAKASGLDLSRIAFYYAFGLFKTAVVLQQIYYRYAKGLTKDPRFAKLDQGVALLIRQAAGAMSGKYLD